MILGDTDNADSTRIKSAVKFVSSEKLPMHFSETLKLVSTAFTEGYISAGRAVEIASEACEKNADERELLILGGLANKFEKSNIVEATDAIDSVRSLIIEYLSDNLTTDIYDFDTFSDVEYGDYDAAQTAVEQLVEVRLNAFDLQMSASAVDKILDYYDSKYELDRYHESITDRNYSHREGGTVTLTDGIDDLFERG